MKPDGVNFPFSSSRERFTQTLCRNLILHHHSDKLNMDLRFFEGNKGGTFHMIAKAYDELCDPRKRQWLTACLFR